MEQYIPKSALVAEIERLITPENGYSMDKLLDFIDSMQEEPVSKQKLSNVERTVKNWKEPVSEVLEEAADCYKDIVTPEDVDDYEHAYFYETYTEYQIADAFKAGAKWQKTYLWKPADCNDLPEIDREVIALLDNGKVVFAHRPPEYWDGKNIITGKVTRNYPKTYDKGGWNIPNVKWWLDCSMPKEIEL